jgi:UDP-GlcNAc3NAcA epimerase
MSGQFFEEMGIDEPTYNLHVGSGSHAKQTAAMLTGIEEVITRENPDALLVYGDTNSTLAGALVAAKMHVPVVHVESGLRSFNKAMPEEINRITCDHLSTLLFTPTLAGLENLKREGFKLHNEHRPSATHPRVYHCGDVMYDNSLYFSEVAAQGSDALRRLGLKPNAYVLCTIHRAENTDYPEHLKGIFEALLVIADEKKLRIVLPLHPRTRNVLVDAIGEELYAKVANVSNLQMIDPVGFIDMIALENNASMVITDSGGVQKEAYFFEKPCIILRDQTEWVELVENGNALLAGHQSERILACFDRMSATSTHSFPKLFGDGKAAHFICETILSDLAND